MLHKLSWGLWSNCLHYGQTMQALAAVSIEDDPRLASVDKRALARVMTYLDRPAHSEGVLAALTVIANLASATPNRCGLQILSHDAILFISKNYFISIVSGREPLVGRIVCWPL